jgi:hypothetical protein
MIDAEMHKINRVILSELRHKEYVRISLILENRHKAITFTKIKVRPDVLAVLDVLTSSGGVKIGIRQKK